MANVADAIRDAYDTLERKLLRKAYVAEQRHVQQVLSQYDWTDDQLNVYQARVLEVEIRLQACLARKR